jgi:hypothetical protein
MVKVLKEVGIRGSLGLNICGLLSGLGFVVCTLYRREVNKCGLGLAAGTALFVKSHRLTRGYFYGFLICGSCLRVELNIYVRGVEVAWLGNIFAIWSSRLLIKGTSLILKLPLLLIRRIENFGICG